MVERMSRNSILGDLCSRLGGIAVEVARLRAALEVDGGRPTETAGSLADLQAEVMAVREGIDTLRRVDAEERRELGHELRTPLNAIAGWAHVLLGEAAASRNVLRAAEVVDRNVRAMASVIEAYTR